MVQWNAQSISNREVAGSIPDDYGRTRLSSLSHTPTPSFILLGGYQQPVYARLCGVVCVSKKKKEKKEKEKGQIGIHWPEKANSKAAAWWIPGQKLVAVNSSALQAVEWCNPSTSCYI